MSPLTQAVALIVGVSALTAIVTIGGLLALLAWEGHEFSNGAYCRSAPNDPLC